MRYLSKEDLNKFQQSLVNGRLSNHTINCYMDIVSTIILFSIQHKNYLGDNPTNLIRKLKVDNKRERILNRSEIDELLESVEDNWILNLFVRLSLLIDGRKSTILNIKKCDVDLESAKITLTDFKNSTTYDGFICDDTLFT